MPLFEDCEAPAGGVEFSPEVRRRIEEIRAQIAAGTYLTSEKLDVVVRRLHAALNEEEGAG